MKITNRDIDSGKPFDWGKTSSDYAKFRDIYPKEFQIKQAKILSKDMDIDYYVISTEDISFSDNSFDVITACQCYCRVKKSSRLKGEDNGI